jgi:molybdopterin/thiamine biosynthesis adenylyltransferase
VNSHGASPAEGALARRARARVLVVGVGGLGSPAAIALARAGVGTIGLLDNDIVEESNLHRQILFGEADVGRDKAEAAASRAAAFAKGNTKIVAYPTRLLPDNAVALVWGYDVVLEGSDNFATKFLTADACMLAGVPVVHAAAVRWHGTVLAVARGGTPCYRCLFEDVPTEGAESCAEAGVMGPMVGVIGALQADLALALIDGSDVGGMLLTFDAKTDGFRRRTIAARAGCVLCGSVRQIASIVATRYTTEPCNADGALLSL